MSRDPSPSDRRPTSIHLRSQPTPSVPGYHVLERLGSGRNATVYRAIQLSMQREVALRVLHPRLSRIAGFAERFMQEARSAGGVHHPNVVSCYDVGQADGLLFQALELVSGRTSAQVRSVHPQGLAVAHALSLVVAATRGLEGIHRVGLVHGDLRLGNIFVADDDVVKLADFGMLRSLEVLRDGDDVVSDLATLAPEQVGAAAQCDIRADIYSMGAVLQVLLTGRMPFRGNNRRDMENAIRTVPLPDLQTLVADLSDDLAAVVVKAMARDPAQRYATPGQLREDLERVQYDFVPIHAMPLTAGTTLMSPREAQRETTAQTPAQRDARVAPAATASAHSPSQTIAKDAGFLLVPRAEESRPRSLVPLIGAGAGVLALALGGWWWMSSTATAAGVTPPPVVAANTAEASRTNVPVWASAGGSDAQGRWADLSVRGVTMRLRSIPAGNFVIGSLDTDPAHRPDEKAVEVTLSRAWWLGDSEVTQAQYRAITGKQPSAFRGDDLPVENVTWNDSLGFIQRLNALVPGLRARLPSEAEWEYACRSGAGSQAATEIGWFSAPDVTGTRPVKRLPSNRWGLYDMLGNVAEWCQDHYGPYPIQPATDPLRLDGVSRVVRGGSWAVDPAEGRPSTRGKYLPVAHHAHIGFRIAIED
jgi:formylglycine-generating enzyme